MTDLREDALVRAAVERGWISEAQAEECRRIQSHGNDASAALDKLRGRPGAEVLLALGYLQPEQVQRLTDGAQANPLPSGTFIDPGFRPADPPPQGTFIDPGFQPSAPRPQGTFIDPGFRPADAHVAQTHATPAPSPGPPFDPVSRPASGATAIDGGFAPHVEVAGHRKLGKYELIKELGRGGMGAVYKAYHPDLATHVAIKVLLADDFASPILLERFLREARASVRSSHPGIVRVHDIGVEGTKPYIVMELVEGANLDAVLDDPTKCGIVPARQPRGTSPDAGCRSGLNCVTAIEITEEIALAVHAAHLVGVVHRDLKPLNVIRDALTGHIKVMDFGLASLVEEGKPGTTRSGEVFGTPAYMSPEQAAGKVHEVDALSDVYQIGATLYELLTGRPPHLGTAFAEIILKVMNEDPDLPTRVNPQIDRDAQIICMKAMARDKTKRYATAQELAQDCRRYLRGQAVLARAEAWWERPARWARRRKLVAGLGAGVLVVALAAGALGLQVYWAGQKAERELLAKTQLEQDVLEGLRTIASVNLSVTLDLRRVGKKMSEVRDRYFPSLERAARKAIAKAPTLAEPHYHLGRVYRAMLDFAGAEKEQDAALGKDPDLAPALYERALLRAIRYRRRVQELREAWSRAEGERLAQARLLEKGGLGGGEMRKAPPDDELAGKDDQARALKAEVAADLARLEKVAGAGLSAPSADGPQIARPNGMLSCARGLRLAYLSALAEDQEKARALLKEAIAADPTLEEAYDALAAMASAAARTDEVVAVFTAGLEVDKGYVPFWIGRGEARFAMGNDRESRGEDPGPIYAEAIADFGRALELNAASADAWTNRGNVRTTWGDFQTNRGGDPGPVYTQAIADYGKALELNPASAEAWMRRGMLRTTWGVFQSNHGGEPGPLFTEAVADFLKAQELNPASAEVWMARGSAHNSWGVFKMNRGEDPGPLYAEAIADYGKALERNPAAAAAWMHRGFVRMSCGLLQMNHGQDPAAIFTEAIADFGAALKLFPGAAVVVKRLGMLRTNWGVYKMNRGEDAGPEFAEAIAAFGQLLVLNRVDADTWMMRGNARMNVGVFKMNRGVDPGADFAGAIADFGTALELNPKSADAWMRRGGTRLNWAAFQESRGEDPGPIYAEAIVDLGKALEVNPGYDQAWMLRGQVRMVWGVAKIKRGEDPAPVFSEARADYDHALALDPGASDKLLRRGLLNYYVQRWSDAVADFEAAIRTNPASEANFRAELAEARAHVAGTAGAQTPPPWLVALQRAEQSLQSGDHAAAGPAFADGLQGFAALAAAERERLLADPGARQLLINAHYNLACELSLASAGKVRLPTPAPTLFAVDAARLRDQAFAELTAALDLGWTDAAHLGADTDLVPLHDDPRWGALVERLKSGKK